jgi:Protein of unknown function (DUF4038)/Putative collagen-binding domain of a collagenase
MRTGIAFVQAILALLLHTNTYAFSVAGNVYGRSAPVASTVGSPDVGSPNVPSNYRTAVSPTFPLKASANNRYLVDQNNVPFLIVGDAPQTLIANLSPGEAAAYMVNRRSYGINTLWINLLCNYSDGCNKEATTFDGIAPFTSRGDLSTPNPDYFERADTMINIAAQNGIVVLLDPIETSSWLGVLRTNGVERAFAYGQYLGGRYKDFPNIIWMHGNDFQSWHTATDDALVQAVARGIRSTDGSHIHTVELNYLTSGSLDDATWAPLIELSAAYTYFPTYAQILAEYNRSDFKPVFLVEANYELNRDPNTDIGSPSNLRRQEYWTMLSGATGQVYGNSYTCLLEKGWETHLDTLGAIQLGYLRDLFAERKWYDLVPDQTHAVVTAGYDDFAGYVGKLSTYAGNFPGVTRIKRLTGFGSIATNTYATAARAADGSLVMAYLPSPRTITIDMSKLAGLATAHWYDPTNGRYVEMSGSPFVNSGYRQFTPPGQNSSGDGDWVLVLEVPIAH